MPRLFRSLRLLLFIFRFATAFHEEEFHHSLDDIPRKMVSAPPRISATSRKGSRSHDDMSRKPKMKKSKSVTVPKKPATVIPAVERYGTLGDAYSVREVRKFWINFDLPTVARIQDWLGAQKFHVKWFNTFNIDAEEDGQAHFTHQSFSSVTNILFIL